jgi:hypothetical protein
MVDLVRQCGEQGLLAERPEERMMRQPRLPARGAGG